MAEAAALAGLGWVVSPVMKDLVTKSISFLGNDIAKDLEDLETTVLPQIQLTMEAAQHSTPNQKAQLAKWLARLKNAYYDAEGILHELEYERLKRKAKGEDKKLLNHVAKFIGPVVKKASLLSSRKRELLHRLNKLKEVAAEAKDFCDLLKGLKKAAEAKTESKDDKAGNSRFDTSSLLTDKVFGRDGYRDEIINFLLDDGDNYSVVAVTGMGGAGKTTLAQYVYNNEKINKFGVKMWLCLSQNLDINERTKEMIECALGTECPNLRNLNALQNKLTETLSRSDSIIVVLDDVWYDNNGRAAEENYWEILLKPFSIFASQGGTCKIIVTSRLSRLFPNALKPKKVIELHDLALDDFKSLLNYRAIVGNLQINDQQLKNDLSQIVDHIAEKMSKSPLAAKVVGNQLREQPNIRFWQATLENVNLSEVREILLWSFNRFDVQLQRCFIFCSVFPKGSPFRSETFVCYWVALDFIQPSNDNRNVEDIALEYFQIMVANSIFQLVDGEYIMHDLFHDLAEKISTKDCFTVTNAESKIPSTVQHVLLKVNNENLKQILSSMSHLSNLRTLLLYIPLIDDICEFFSKVSTNCRNLRVLVVASLGYKTLPKVVGNLKNLRLLNLGWSSIEELPDSVVQLYHLQFLLLPSSVKTLPKKLSNLVKLRHIKMFNSDGICVNKLPPVPYLGKLTSLQCLGEFHVRKEEGYELHQLGPLKEIGDSLRIVNLHNVRNKDEAVKAMLIDKPKLKEIALVWDESAENGSELEVIEALRPPLNLEKLSIVQYRGSTYPTWLEEDCFTNNIKFIGLYRCNALTIIPRNFQQFCHCSVLILKQLDALREFPTFPENLTSLAIIECPCLIFVCENELPVDENQSMMEREFFRNFLSKDVLHNELKSFEQTGSKENCADQFQILESATQDDAPEFPLNLNVNRSAWWRCHQQRMNFTFSCNTRANKLKLSSRIRILSLGCCCVSDGALSECLNGMTALEKLYLYGIMTITTLPPTQVMKPLQSLRVLEIKNCLYLRSLGGLHALPHLESFILWCCLCLEMESGYTSRKLPPTLQSLSIMFCIVSQAIFNSDLSCLQNVVIENCSVPRCLSFCQLTLLKSLTLDTCPGLVSIRGLESSPSINCLKLIELPDLDVEVLESWQGCRELVISSSVMLNKFLLSQDFVPPKKLIINSCQEEVISFEKSDHLQSIKILGFLNCKTSRLPETLSDFSTLEAIHFIDCQNISGLPELPSSVKHIQIRGCPVLSKRCQPKGVDRHKIQNIQDKWIE